MSYHMDVNIVGYGTTNGLKGLICPNVADISFTERVAVLVPDCAFSRLVSLVSEVGIYTILGVSLLQISQREEVQMVCFLLHHLEKHVAPAVPSILNNCTTYRTQENPSAAGAPLRTTLGSLQHSPRTPSWWGRGWLPSPRTTPPARPRPFGLRDSALASPVPPLQNRAPSVPPLGSGRRRPRCRRTVHLKYEVSPLCCLVLIIIIIVIIIYKKRFLWRRGVLGYRATV